MFKSNPVRQVVRLRCARAMGWIVLPLTLMAGFMFQSLPTTPVTYAAACSSTANYLLQMTLDEKVGSQLDESFQFAMDWDLLLHFQQVGTVFQRLPRYLAALSGR